MLALGRYRRASWSPLVALAAISGVAQHPVVAVAQQAGATASLVFDGATVVDVENGKLLPDQRVVVTGNRIQAMGRGVPVPKGAQVVDAKGKYLIPGLWDLHVHPRRSAHHFYPLLIANGGTGIRDAWSEVPFDTLKLWRREILAGTRVGPPRQLLSGPAIDESRECKRGLNDGHTCVSLADSADPRRLVDSLKAAGVDMLKLYGVSPAMYFTLAAEARRIGMRFGGHAQSTLAVDVADSGATLIDHQQHRMGPQGLRALCWAGTSSASVEQCGPVAERLKRSGTWFVPTLAREGGAGGTHAKRIAARITERAKEFWEGKLLRGNWLRDSAETSAGAVSDSLGALHLMRRVGLPIVAGTDAGAPVLKTLPPGFALHAELAMYVVEGFTPLHALQTATLNPAKMLRATDSLGTVAPGKLADLVLLDADPLADITNTTMIRAVVANGRYFDRAALDKLLTDVQATGGR